MSKAKMSNYYICQCLLNIFRDMSILFTRRQLKDPCFGLSISKKKRSFWTHSWSESGVLYVKAWADTLDCEAVMKNMIHIIIHTYNWENKISDMVKTSSGFHKKGFKKTAQEFMINTVYDKNKGYLLAEIPDEVREDCMRIIKKYSTRIEKNLKAYMLQMEEASVSKRTSFVTYQCPICKKKIKAVDNSYVICGVDKVAFEKI